MTWGTTTLMDWLGQALCCQRPARSAGSVSGESAESVEDQFQSPDSKQRVVVRGEPMASSFENLPSPALSPALSVSSPLPLRSPPLRSRKLSKQTCGSKWENFGSEKPAWCSYKLIHDKLAEALQRKVDCNDTDFEFSAHEMEELGLNRSLSYSCYIEVKIICLIIVWLAHDVRIRPGSMLCPGNLFCIITSLYRFPN